MGVSRGEHSGDFENILVMFKCINMDDKEDGYITRIHHQHNGNGHPPGFSAGIQQFLAIFLPMGRQQQSVSPPIILCPRHSPMMSPQIPEDMGKNEEFQMKRKQREWMGVPPVELMGG